MLGSLLSLLALLREYPSLRLSFRFIPLSLSHPSVHYLYIYSILSWPSFGLPGCRGTHMHRELSSRDANAIFSSSVHRVAFFPFFTKIIAFNISCVHSLSLFPLVRGGWQFRGMSHRGALRARSRRLELTLCSFGSFRRRRNTIGGSSSSSGSSSGSSSSSGRR